MKKWRIPILVCFYVTLSSLVIFRIVTIPKKSERLQEVEEETRIKNLYFYTTFWQGVSVAAAASALLAGVLIAGSVSLAKLKRASVHTYEIGQSKVIVHERDLSLAWPIATGLMNAEKLEHLNGGMEKALELYGTMANIQNQQIRALMHGRQVQKTLPEKADSEEHFTGHIPTFSELVRNGELARGKPMILGYIHGHPRRGSFLDIYSAAVAGESGSGKTSTVLFLIGSAIISAPVRFVGIDPHYPHPKSLGFKTKPLWDAGVMRMATFKDDMLTILNDVEHTIENRLKQIDQDTTPMVLVIDELAFLSTTPIGPRIARVMERISTEGRKCSVYMLASSQTWLTSRTGDSSVVRDTLTSAYVHRIKPRQANLLLQDRDEAEKVKRYVKQAGEALLCPVGSESEVVRMPLTTEDDMHLVAEMVTSVTEALPAVTGRRYSPVTAVVTGDDQDVTIQQMLQHPPVSLSRIAQETGINKGYLYQIAQGKTMSADARQKLEAYQKTLTN